MAGWVHTEGIRQEEVSYLNLIFSNHHGVEGKMGSQEVCGFLDTGESVPVDFLPVQLRILKVLEEYRDNVAKGFS